MMFLFLTSHVLGTVTHELEQPPLFLVDVSLVVMVVRTILEAVLPLAELLRLSLLYCRTLHELKGFMFNNLCFKTSLQIMIARKRSYKID